MSETSFFFDGVAGDRDYTSSQFRRYMDLLFGTKSGVLGLVANGLAVTAPGAYQAIIATGAAVKDGAVYENDASLTKTLAAVASTYKRIDLVVVRFDPTTARSAVVTVIQGTATTGTPTAPSAAGTDLSLASILIDNSSGTPAYTVTDLRSNRVFQGDLKDVIVDARAISGAGQTLTVAPLLVGQTAIIDFMITTTGAGGSYVLALPAGGTYSAFIFSPGSAAMSGTFVGPNTGVSEAHSPLAIPGGSTVTMTAGASGNGIHWFGIVRRIS